MTAFLAYCSNFLWLLVFVVSFDSLCPESDNKPLVTPGRGGRAVLTILVVSVPSNATWLNLPSRGSKAT